MSATSPTSSTIFPRSHSPTKNSHPYAIKTTSTAVLSGGSSGSHPISSHSYVPPSPSPSPSRSTMGLPKSGSRHRYSRSLTSDSPRPLPAPPSPTKRSEFETPPSGRTKRADTLPSIPPTPATADELPSNPKVWTPSQLSSYLSRALRVKSGEAILNLPIPIAKDIAAFVRESKITGRIFLRFGEDDLEKYGINKPWRTALLSASRTLKQNILQGQIWGFSRDAEDDEDGTPNSRSYTSNRSSPTHSLIDPIQMPPRGRYKNGRVRGMVASFERSSSVDDGPAMRRRERSGSVSSCASSDYNGEDDGGHWAPDGDGSGRPLPLPPHPYQTPSFPNSAASSGESEYGIAYYSQRPLPDRPIIYPVYFESGPSSSPPICAPIPSRPEEPTVAELLEASPSTGATLWEMDPGETARRIPVAPQHITAKHPEEELSMEDLLLEVGGSTVDAWERDAGMGVTVKRVDEVQTGRLTQEALREFDSSLRSGKAKTRSGRRDVNDIFGLGREESIRVDVGVSTSAEVETTRDVTEVGVQGYACDVVEIGVGQDAEWIQIPEQGHIDHELEEKQKSLEQSLLETRKMVEIFKERLQAIERKVEGMERLAPGREVVEMSTRAPMEQPTQCESPSIHPRILLGKLLGTFFRPSIVQSLSAYIPLLREPAVLPSAPTPSSRDRRRRLLGPYGYTSPQTLSALPSYVLIVGIGVCAVVLRVMLKKSLRSFRR